MRRVERKRMNPEQRKYFLVGSLCIAIFLMLGIGYAVLSTGELLWTISPIANHSGYVISIGRSGALLGFGADQVSTYPGTVSPVFYLSSDISLSGLGTQSNPFVIG